MLQFVLEKAFAWSGVEEMMQDDTISAVATAIGEGGIGIIRMSGSEALAIANLLFRGVGGKLAQDVPSYHAAYGAVVDPKSGQTVDEVLLLIMRAPKSYTREDVVEIHCHGGPVPLRRILELTLRYGARLAEPGEFTKRAFLNGRLDLPQAEAVIDVIRAKTDVSLKLALNNLSGSLSVRIGSLRKSILQMIAQLEASIDFPEEDIEVLTANQVANDLLPVMAEIQSLLATANTGRILREGLQTVIIGKPNVGKSSLMNALLRENRAIVTNIPGTTRDVIEEYVNIQGIPLKIVDTAGLRETDDLVEQIGVQRARDFIASADLLLIMLDASSPLSPEDSEVLELLENRQAIVLINKSDLPAKLDKREVEAIIAGMPVIALSTHDGTGLNELEEAIVNKVYGGHIIEHEGTFVNNVRHTHLLRKALESLEEAGRTIDAQMPPDCIVIDLRAAWERMGEITGETVNEDIIDQIFSQFCIGK